MQAGFGDSNTQDAEDVQTPLTAGDWAGIQAGESDTQDKKDVQRALTAS
jgi:hypothetical protein